MNNTIHDIFVSGTNQFMNELTPSYQQLKVLNHINACKTPQMGAAVFECECGKKTVVFHSCRDRHCPVCQGMSNKRWADKQMASSLPVKYWHLVFTIPDSLNPLILRNQKVMYDALFDASSQAVLKLSEDPKFLGATPGFTSVLHTWGQTMQFHPHIHMILTAGGLTDDEKVFIDKSDATFLFPFKVLSKLFRGIFLDLVSKNIDIDQALLSDLYGTDFSCHIEDTVFGANYVIKYLARYINRVCISDKRIVNFDKSKSEVTFSYKDNRDDGKQKQMTVSVSEFIRRFLLHVLPKRFIKIRHYGILNNFDKFKRIKRCRRLLKVSLKLTPRIPEYIPLCSKCKSELPKPKHIAAEHFTKYIRLIC